MLRFVKGTLRRLIQYVFVSSGSRESLWNILFARTAPLYIWDIIGM